MLPARSQLTPRSSSPGGTIRTDDVPRADVTRLQEEPGGDQDQLTRLRGELEAARRSHDEAERRAAAYAEELQALQSGLGWRALASYRHVARRVAPTGTRRGNGYDLAVATARRSAGRLLRRFESRGVPVVRSGPDVAADRGPAADEDATDGPVVAGPPGVDTWFEEHYDAAAARVIEFLAQEGVALEGKQVADVGSGDGILDLGLVHKGRPARLVGFDVNLTNCEILLESARRQGVCESLPSSLAFEASGPTSIPAEDRSFDVVVSWSAFEHIADPIAVLREVRRVIRDDGVLFVQLWPFYHSRFGSHLRDWFPEGWEHLEMSAEDIDGVVRASDVHAADWADLMLHEYRGLNRISVDDLGRALVDAGFVVRRLHLLTSDVPLPPGPASHLPLSALGIDGVELVAVPV
jgi:SAM-dependent methyltransferase